MLAAIVGTIIGDTGSATIAAGRGGATAGGTANTGIAISESKSDSFAAILDLFPPREAGSRPSSRPNAPFLTADHHRLISQSRSDLCFGG